MSAQKPLELILARNLLSSISTPAFLVGETGDLLFYNEAAGVLLGRSFDETGALPAQAWTAMFGPLDEHDEAMPYELIPATAAVRENRPYHGSFRVTAAGGRHQDIEASAIPIVGQNGSGESGGASGAIVIFWPVTDDRISERTASSDEESERE